MTNSDLALARRFAGPQEQSDETGLSEAGLELGAAFGRDVIERDIRPRLIADANMRPLWVSPSAARLLRTPFPVYLKNEQVCFEDRQAARDGKAFLASLDEQRRRLLVTSREEDCWVLVSGWARQANGRRLLFLTFGFSEPTIGAESSGLASHFGLTKAEAAVLDEFARLHSPDQVARHLKVTINTVRSHLKRIHTKMSVCSNTRLLQIVRAFGDS